MKSSAKSSCCLLQASLLLFLLFNSEDWGDTLLRIIGCLSSDYTPYIPVERSFHS
jgi:hypothetical protein